MSDIRRYDPFSIEPIGDVLQNMFRRWPVVPALDLPFRVDVSESDGSYTVTADLPGVKKEDINIGVDRRTVTILAKLAKSAETKQGDRVIRQERYSGSMQRAFTLGADIDTDKIDASFQDGVLHVVLPKREGTQPQRITIR